MEIQTRNDELPLTLENLYLTFAEFFRVWMNIICYERELYPRESFKLGSLTSFGLAVPINRHPAVVAWQNELVESLLSNFLLNDNEKCVSQSAIKTKSINKIKDISLVIFEQIDGNDNSKKQVERFVIDLSMLRAVSSDTEILNRKIIDLSWISVYESFRSLIYDILNNLRDDQNSEANNNSGTPCKDNHEQYKKAPRTFDIFLSTDKSFLPKKIINQEDDSDWIIDSFGTAISSSLTVNTASTWKEKVKIKHFRSIEIDPLIIYCHVDKIIK